MGKLVVLMITAFIDMAGVLMVVPLLPFYAKNMGAGGFVVGALVASFAIAQIISAPMWGRFSDRYGRRPALLVGLGASAFAYIIFAYANSLFLLFLSRIVQGAGGGTVGVIQAYVTDAVEPKDRARALGWLSAATNAGVAIGPVIGSASTHFSHRAPGFLAAALCVVNVIFAAKFLVETHDTVEAKKQPQKKGRSREAAWQIVRNSSEPKARLIWIYAIGMGAFMGMNAILALFLAARFGVTEKTIGFFYLYIGVISIVTRAGILGRAVDKFGEPKLSRLGMSLLAIGLVTLPFIHRFIDAPALGQTLNGEVPVTFKVVVSFIPILAAVALIPLGTAFTFPCVTALLSRVIPSNERGLWMGLQQTFGGIARVVFPLLAGFLFDRMIALPFLVSATLVVGTIFLGLGMEEYTKPKPPPEVEVVSPA
jgi:multidrug resistance protein